MTDKKVNEADSIWAEIRNLPIEMFALPNQRVENHLLRVRGVPNELYLTAKSPAALPALEALLGGQVTLRVERTAEGDPINVSHPKFEMEETELYIVIRRHVPPTERLELQPVATRASDNMVVVPGEVDSPVLHAPLAPKVVKPE
ncbi:hypothetical protein LCGC14_0526210 [marine sediment metagenome]|uniref:Uncharacterized protein n=1 Tax=marine sediment metagenome TaxID=412755 RepID=A0A0F9UID0_9ZZZZ